MVVYELIIIEIQDRSLVRRKLNKKKRKRIIGQFSRIRGATYLYKRNRKAQFCSQSRAIVHRFKKKIPFDFVKWKIEKEKNGKNHDHTKNTMKYV